MNCIWLTGGKLIDAIILINILEYPAEKINTAGTFQRFTGTASPTQFHPSLFKCVRARAYTHMNTHTAAKLPIITQVLCLKIRKSP